MLINKILSLFQRCLLLKTLGSSLHLHLHVSCHSVRLVSLVLDTWLNILTFMFLTTPGTYNFVYGSLILLPPPLHLFILTLWEQNEGSLLLILIICGFFYTLYYSLKHIFMDLNLIHYNQKMSLLQQTLS